MPATLVAAAKQPSPGASASDDSEPLLIATGPHADSAAFAQWLWERLLAEDPTLTGGVRTIAWTKDETSLLPIPGHRVLVVVENAVLAVARALSSCEAVDVHGVLSEWCDRSRRLLRVAHRPDARCLLLDLHEASNAPGAVARAIGRWDRRFANLHARFDGLDLPDPLCMAIARNAVRASPAAQQLFDEVLASCVVVDDASAAQASRTEFLTAQEAYRKLVMERDAARVAQDGLRGSITGLEHEIETLRQQLASSAVALHEAESTSDAHAAQAAAERQSWSAERSLLVRQLGQAQQELDRLFVEGRQRVLAAYGDDAGLDGDPSASPGVRPAARAAASKQHADSRDRLAAAQHENQLLILQMHQMQEELERQFLQLRSARRQRHLGRPLLEAPAAGNLLVLHRTDAAPHRTLHFEITELQLEHRTLSRVDVRLVEHVGRPGLAFFGTTGRPEVLASWVPDGTEDGRPYMLLIPSDTSGQQRLERLGTSDWKTVTALASLLDQWVGDEGQYLGELWRNVATRLCRQLANLPPRLRYDALTVTRCEEEPESHCLEVAFERVVYGEDDIGTVRLRWRLGREGGRTDSLEWLMPGTADPLPISQWPIDPSGRFEPAFAVPVGRPRSDDAKPKRWAALSTPDRALVLAVLDALQAVPSRAADGAATAGVDQRRIAEAASRLHKEARLCLRKQKLMSLARRVLPTRSAAA